ncbi:MotE family protein [Bacillus pumilus]|uniref:MotE family protein n=1 Tax=Bacillus pumilus TaxID=1408 RepID=UPI001E464A2D|nr:MotE family protein [Bacillus pumilus]MCC9087106.1 MotE family protein [Bacillus pumilus]
MPKKEKAKESSGGKFQWILFIVIIPLIVLVIVTGTILYIAGFDLKKPLQNIPVISSLVGSDDSSKTSSSHNDQRDEELGKLKNTIKEQKNELEIAQKDLKTSDEEIKRLNQKINSLEKTTENDAENTSANDSSSNNSSSNNTSGNNTAGTTSDGAAASNQKTKGKITSIYESMDAGKSAKILSELSDKEALKILEELSKNKLTDILAKLTPQKAATFTKELAKKEESENGGGQ